MLSLQLQQNQTETRPMTTALTETLAQLNTETMEKQTSTARQYEILRRACEQTTCILHTTVYRSNTAFFLTDA